MEQPETITFYSQKEKVTLEIRTIIYIMMERDYATFHYSGGEPIRALLPMVKIEKMLGKARDSFIKIKRGCLVSVFAIHNITETVNLGNGETLEYATRQTQNIFEEFWSKQRKFVHDFASTVTPKTASDFHEHYRVFDTLPIAFTDIEMIFDDANRAVDWVFCYANDALAELEQMPLSSLIGSRFGKVFPNMDSRWLKAYEWATLFGEVLQLVDYSPEIGTNLKIICFPTFKGHCGCILFDIEKLKFFRNVDDTERAIAALVNKILT